MHSELIPSDVGANDHTTRWNHGRSPSAMSFSCLFRPQLALACGSVWLQWLARDVPGLTISPSTLLPIHAVLLITTG
jgi:hypothetical protein